MGSKVCANSDPLPALKWRIEKAWKYFWAKKSIFMNREAGLRQRISLWYKTCACSLLWGLETLTLMNSHVEILEREAQLMIVKMMSLKRRMHDNEQWIPWMQRKMKSARWMLSTSSVLQATTSGNTSGGQDILQEWMKADGLTELRAGVR